MMQKYKKVPKSLYCNFCKSVGHDDSESRTLELMREITSNNYKVQEDMMTGKFAPYFNNVQPQFNPTQLKYKNAQPQYNATQSKQIPNTMHHEEIEVYSEV
jgi:radical SAM superfamily enzyme